VGDEYCWCCRGCWWWLRGKEKCGWIITAAHYTVLAYGHILIVLYGIKMAVTCSIRKMGDLLFATFCAFITFFRGKSKN
jgi:hypothetical protein